MVKIRNWLGLIVLASVLPAQASEVEITMVELVRQGTRWQASVTLRHQDTGWDHYADAWRLVTASGDELARRVLVHPHVDEQPFTRLLAGIAIPEEVKIVFVEAHDSVHGWAAERVRVNLEEPRGERYRVRR